MQIVVTNLTRMQHGNVCVAGVRVEDGEHVRPVLRLGQFRACDLAPLGGPFDLATVVELGPAQPIPTLPHAEDHEIKARAARSVGAVDPTLFWDMLQFLARPSLRTLFGDELRRVGKGAAVPEGRGVASLGCLRPAAPPRLYVTTRPDGRRSIRIRFRDDQLDPYVSVTDLRLYRADGETPDEERVSALNRRMEEGEAVLLGVGLTRAFASSPEHEPLHWLQVNNLHLERTPAWRLADNPRADNLRTFGTPHALDTPYAIDTPRVAPAQAPVGAGDDATRAARLAAIRASMQRGRRRSVRRRLPCAS